MTTASLAPACGEKFPATVRVFAVQNLVFQGGVLPRCTGEETVGGHWRQTDGDAVSERVQRLLQGEMTIGDTINVYIISRNRLLRESLARIFKKQNDISILTGDALTSATLQEICDSGVDVVLIDSINALLEEAEKVRELRRTCPNLNLVVVCMEENEETFLRAVQLGVTGYVLKEASAIDVTAAVRTAARGEASCPPRLCHYLIEFVARQSDGLPTARMRELMNLTRREQLLIPLLARGLTNKEIAEKLNLSEQTVKNYVHRILRKTGVQDRLAAVEVCRTAGLNL
jgi:DNA-binding NarL/FixJ family response regulator